MSADIFLNIDSIVLQGLDHVDRHVLEDALKQHMTEQLVSRPGLTAADLTRMRTNISLPAGAGSEKLGQALGQSLGSLIINHEKRMRSTPEAKTGGRHAQ